MGASKRSATCLTGLPAGGLQTTIVVDAHPFWFESMRDELSPEGDKALPGPMNLTVLFLDPPH